jgi:hypothetical protein
LDVAEAGAFEVVVARASELPLLVPAPLSLSELQPDATRNKVERTSVRITELRFSMKTFPPVGERTKAPLVYR